MASQQDNIWIEETIYDTVIIGGGIAGLTAAYMLRDKKLLLLEQEDRFGGIHEHEIQAIFGEDDQALFGRWGGPVTAAFFSDYASKPKHIRAVLLRTVRLVAQSAWGSHANHR